MHTIACIVTYEPDIDVLVENVRAVSAQVDGLTVVDNGSSNAGAIAAALPGGVVLRRLPDNLGLSRAMNIAVRQADDRGADYVLMLDQDSVVTPQLVPRLRGVLAEDDELALVGPDIQDRNLGERPKGDEVGTERVNACITSGSLLRVDDWRAIGGWDERLFVDFVDFDLCLRLRSAGRGIAIEHGVVLHHAIGQARRVRAGVAWGHGAARLEHMATDVVRYARKHRSAPTELQVVPNSTTRALALLGWKSLMVVLHEDAKVAKVRAIIRGTVRGLRSSVTAP
jgi:rhamnosyltransferase